MSAQGGSRHVGIVILPLLLIASAMAGGQSVQDGGAQPVPSPVVITLADAIKRAEANEPTFAYAKGASRSAQLDRSIATAGLLPTARLFSAGIYTQPNGIRAEGGQGVNTPDPKFVANDSRPREVITQGAYTMDPGTKLKVTPANADASNSSEGGGGN